MKPDAVRASVNRIRQSCDEELMKEKERIMSQIYWIPSIKSFFSLNQVEVTKFYNSIFV
jgi:hypothetical protein